MRRNWTDRNTIVANLFNPAFCAEIIRVVAMEYNKHTNTKFPFVFSFIVLPILLHKETRERLPRSTRTYFFVWVGNNDNLFFDFSKRAKNMVKYTKEALSFSIAYNKMHINEKGEIETDMSRVKKFNGEEYDEYNDILKKAQLLGKWLSFTSDVKSIYSFLRITP